MLRHRISINRDYEAVVFWHSAKRTFMGIIREKPEVHGRTPRRSIWLGDKPCQYLRLTEFERDLQKYHVVLTGDVRRSLIQARNGHGRPSASAG